MVRLRCFFLLVIALVLGFGPGCSEESRGTIVQELDLKVPEGIEKKFSKNNILETAEFTDGTGLDTAGVQRFLGKTPYERASFLETYQSNGTRASDAIIQAARTYRINPLVFLVFAQTQQGLVGERTYPFPPERVEYLFNCGCLQTGECQPELAGFDRQVDCLGRRLRSFLEEIGASQQTSSGWGPEKTSTTLDGEKVTPENEATAVIYAQLPRVNEASDGGAWLFWNVWNIYAAKTEYSGPIGGGAGLARLGEACVGDTSCSFEQADCVRNFTGGYCSKRCDNDSECTLPDQEGSCIEFPNGGYCMVRCNPSSSNCREGEGYRCERLRKLGGTSDLDTEFVCHFPN